MQTTTVSATHRAGSSKPYRLRPGLAAIHAKALRRLVPPVYFDDDGYVCEDNSHMPESEVHFPILSYWHGAQYGHYRSRGRLVCVLADHLLLVDRDVGTAEGKSVWLRDPETGHLLPDHAGAMGNRDRTEAQRQRAETERQRAERERQLVEAQRQRALEENAKLRAEIRQLRSGKT
ncbi:MAG: hypothetical protein OXI79_07150 [Gammaproteobacteria bacterium]|nr:hypothetical protein [Gammaproteobacteria bacterium]